MAEGARLLAGRLAGRAAGLALLLALAAPAAFADTDAGLERRVNRLSEELRCVVCQNQSLADSQTELAADLRQQVREQLAAGRSEDEVREHLVQRYGDFVLYRPPLKPLTWLLWAGPLLLAGGGLAAFLLRWRRGRDLADAGPEDDDHDEDAPAGAATP